MNKTKIEWTDYVWNPVRGCLHNCPYCYGKRIDRRFGDGSFTPTFYPERLTEPLKVKKPSRIFVGSMADLFGDWNWNFYGPDDEEGFPQQYTRHTVVWDILRTVRQCPQHTFIFLTKNPKGMQGIDFPDNCWCGTSVENQEKADERIPELLRVNCETLFVSHEPALGPIDFTDIQYQKMRALDAFKGLYGFFRPHIEGPRLKWLIIGAQTGPGAVKPNPEWINRTIEQARSVGVPLFVKDNVKWPEQIREYPEGVKSCE